jgi:hypothetical protein
MAAIETRCEKNRMSAMPQRSESPIQKLVIPSFSYQVQHLNSRHIYSDIKKEIPEGAGGSTGVLLTSLLPFKSVLKRNGNPAISVERDGNITVVRQYSRALIPLRFIRPERRIQAICSLGMKAYDAYFETAGRPDIVYAYDCLYAGVIAKMLHAAYGLPYIVISRRFPSKDRLHSKALMSLAREVLLDASCVHVIGQEPYRLLKEEFGDLDVIKNALVV